jgi:MFS family permease
LIGCWISDPLNNWFGRRGEIFITSIILILTPIGSGFSQNWYQLFAIRLVLGIGMGAKAATVPMYAAELSPAVVRGALVMGWQLWTAFGIFIGTCANAVVKDVSPFGRVVVQR